MEVLKLASCTAEDADALSSSVAAILGSSSKSRLNMPPKNLSCLNGAHQVAIRTGTRLFAIDRNHRVEPHSTVGYFAYDTSAAWRGLQNEFCPHRSYAKSHTQGALINEDKKEIDDNGKFRR
jgi:hypothetical protein